MMMVWRLPYAIDCRMHSEEVTNLGAFTRDTTNKAFGEASQVKAVHHVKASNSTLERV